MKDILKNKKVLIGIAIFVIALIGIVAYLTTRTKNYTVSFNTDGGEHIKSVEIEDGKNYKLPTELVKEGYIFNGWSLDGEKLSNEIKITKDIELKSNWIKEGTKTFEIKFNTDGGNKINTQLVEENAKLVMPKDPVKNGYKFIKWLNEDNKEIKDGRVITYDMLLTAVWEKVEEKDELENTKKEYYCEEDYKLSDDFTKCTKIEETKTNKKTVCDDGYTLENRACVKTVAAVCTGSGYVESGKYCFKNLVDNRQFTNDECERESGYFNDSSCYKIRNEKQCEPGTQKTDINGSIVCKKIISPKTISTCPSGYKLDNNKCTKTVTINSKTR